MKEIFKKIDRVLEETQLENSILQNKMNDLQLHFDRFTQKIYSLLLNLEVEISEYKKNMTDGK